jgi:hypothetical protein
MNNNTLFKEVIQAFRKLFSRPMLKNRPGIVVHQDRGRPLTCDDPPLRRGGDAFGSHPGSNPIFSRACKPRNEDRMTVG